LHLVAAAVQEDFRRGEWGTGENAANGIENLDNSAV
jgi:hypothetical protein